MEKSKKTKVIRPNAGGDAFLEDKEGTQAKRILKKYISDEGKGVVNNPRGKKPGVGFMGYIVRGVEYKDLDKDTKDTLSKWGMNKKEFDQMSKEIIDLYNKTNEKVGAGLKKGGAVKKKAKSPLFKVTNRGPLKKKKI